MKKLDNKGQAIFELIIFLPFLVIFYSIIYSVGNALNSSINQQKAVRGYFYAITKGNSYLNTFSNLKELTGRGLNKVGFASIGWRERSENDGGDSYAPCFSFPQLMKSGVDDECDKPDRSSDTSRHIRVYTAYGVCGPHYEKDSDFFKISPEAQSSNATCTLDK